MEILVLEFRFKSCDLNMTCGIFNPNYLFHHKFAMQAFWIGETIPTSNQNSQTSKAIEVDISTYLGYPVKALG